MIQPEEKQRPAPGEAASDTMTTTTTTDVVCGKTARACDGCARRRARWYCGADDAFLCQGCDSSVHSANLVARRHQRVRLKTASSPPPSPTPSSCGVVLQAVEQEEAPVPAWLNGFRRKARTPRSQGQAKVVTRSTEPQAPTAVPKLVETSMEHNEEEEEDEHAALYRVPVFDPVLSGFCSAPPPLDDANASSACDAKSSVTAEISDCAPTTSASSTGDASDGQLSAFLPTDVELAEFAANMESLLNGAVEDGNDSFCMEKLGLLDLMDQDGGSCFRGAKPVKAEKHLDVYRDHDNHAEQDDVDASRVTLELSFDLGSPVNGDDAAEEKTARVGATEDDAAEQGVAKTARLRLNYEAIIAAWASQGSSPWTDGKRPQVIKDGRWTEYMGLWMHGAVQMQGAGGGAALDDVGREARVTRYREKRRTRLFSKKIRYEVRKLNAEKRPRIKGRFVKRAPGVALGIAHWGANDAASSMHPSQ